MVVNRCWQMLPSLAITCKLGTCRLCCRTLGALTGTRCAGMLGRVPVEDTVRTILEQLQSRGYHLGEAGNFVGSSHVDNIYFFSHSVGGAIISANLFEQELARRWRQKARYSPQENLGSLEVLVEDNVFLCYPLVSYPLV